MLALPEGHPLATATEIDHRRLKVEPIISIAATLNPSFSQVFPDFCERLGYSPRVIHEVNTLSEIFDLVRLGLGIGFVKKSAAAVSTENGIAFKALSGSQPYIDTGVAYRNGPLSPSLEKLVELLREHQRWSTQDKRLEETRDV